MLLKRGTLLEKKEGESSYKRENLLKLNQGSLKSEALDY
jgi:hypothetical protein